MMKTVVHIVDEKVVVQEVPDDWIQCSVLGEFRPPEEFRKASDATQSRTNCTRAYEMPVAEWEYYKSVQRKLYSEIQRRWSELNKAHMEKTAGISVSAMIEALQALQKTNPDARIVHIDVDGDMVDPWIELVHGYKNVFSV